MAHDRWKNAIHHCFPTLNLFDPLVTSPRASALRFIPRACVTFPTHPHESQRYVPYMTVRKFEHIRKLSGPCPLRRTTDIAPNRNHNAGDHSLRKQPNLRTVGSEKDRTLPTSGSSSISVLCSHFNFDEPVLHGREQNVPRSSQPTV